MIQDIGTVLAVFIRVRNLQLQGWLQIEGVVILILLQRSDLRYLQAGHSIKKCFSSSTSPGQNGQNLKVLSIFLCLPFSIIRAELDILNFVSAVLFLTHDISSRYFSKPGVVLKRAYVLSLLTPFFYIFKCSLVVDPEVFVKILNVHQGLY